LSLCQPRRSRCDHQTLDNISEDDLVALIRNGVSEGRTIEYKRELPGNADGDKKEFLADVSSFANTSGGHLVFGMEEDKGLPISISGFLSSDPDLELRRLDSMIADGLDPKIRYALKIIQCSAGGKVLVIQIAPCT
jgi:predicted HTH transcriptional regulator